MLTFLDTLDEEDYETFDRLYDSFTYSEEVEEQPMTYDLIVDSALQLAKYQFWRHNLAAEEASKFVSQNDEDGDGALTYNETRYGIKRAIEAPWDEATRKYGKPALTRKEGMELWDILSKGLRFPVTEDALYEFIFSYYSEDVINALDFLSDAEA